MYMLMSLNYHTASHCTSILSTTDGYSSKRWQQLDNSISLYTFQGSKQYAISRALPPKPPVPLSSPQYCSLKLKAFLVFPQSDRPNVMWAWLGKPCQAADLSDEGSYTGPLAAQQEVST